MISKEEEIFCEMKIHCFLSSYIEESINQMKKNIIEFVALQICNIPLILIRNHFILHKVDFWVGTQLIIDISFLKNTFLWMKKKK